jgi:hypothetical protein
LHRSFSPLIFQFELASYQQNAMMFTAGGVFF